MTRTVSAKTDGVDQSPGASPGCSLSPSLTRTSSVQGLSLVAAHPNRVVLPPPTVSGSPPSVTRSCSNQLPPSPNSRMHPRTRRGSQLSPTPPADFGKVDSVVDGSRPGIREAYRRRSTNSRKSLNTAPNLDIQRVRGNPQVWATVSLSCLDSVYAVLQERQSNWTQQPLLCHLPAAACSSRSEHSRGLRSSVCVCVLCCLHMH